MYEFRNLENVSLEELTKTWNTAFSDYVVPVDVSPERLVTYFKVAGVDFSRSFGAFCDGGLVGMLMNSVGTFKGMTVAYDAMTGIVPEHRGRKLFSRLFDHTRGALKSLGISRYYLEVIKTNERAYNIYSAKGGKIERELSFLTGRTEAEIGSDIEVKAEPLSAFPNEEISSYVPSFRNQMYALRRNADDYNVAYAGGTMAVYNTIGRITQIIDRERDEGASLRAVLSYLSNEFDKLEIADIPVTETMLIAELVKTGFTVLLNQFEMSIELL